MAITKKTETPKTDKAVKTPKAVSAKKEKTTEVKEKKEKTIKSKKSQIIETIAMEKKGKKPKDIVKNAETLDTTSVSRRKVLADSELLIDTIVKSMQEKKAKDIVSLDLHAITTRVSDHFIICHGTSTTQVSAIADSVEHLVRKNLKIKPWHKEGTENSEWVLIDYCDVVVHIFEKEKRDFYDIENLWADAEIMEFDNVE